jgi:hypothetical protein
MCLDPYWVNQWLKNFGAGFAKRGLLGEVATHMFAGRINLLLLNLISLFLLLLLAYGIVLLLGRLGNPYSLPQAALFTSLLWLTPFGKSLSETAGDPLQVVAVLLIVLVLLADRWRLRGVSLDLGLSFVFCLSILIHEGSFLLLMPAFLVMGRRSWVWWIGLSAALLMTWFFSAAEPLNSQDLIANRLIGFHPHTGLELSYRAGGGIASQVSFLGNLKMEFMKYIQNPSEVVGEVYRTFVLILFLALCFCCWIQQYSTKVAELFIRVWLLYLPITLPFFLITHDWVRYGVINLVGCLCCTVAIEARRGNLEHVAAARSMQKLAEFTRSWPWILLLALAILIGPNLDDKDIRTQPHPRLSKKYTLLCVVAIGTAVVQKRQLFVSPSSR